MKSIRTFAYAAVLALSFFTLQPSLASAEDGRGTFTLSHEVHWQKVVLQPGEYTFSLVTMGPSEFLTIRALDGGRTSAMLMSTDVERSQPDDVSQLVLVERGGQSFVSALELPEYEMTLHFAIPSESPSK